MRLLTIVRRHDSVMEPSFVPPSQKKRFLPGSPLDNYWLQVYHFWKFKLKKRLNTSDRWTLDNTSRLQQAQAIQEESEMRSTFGPVWPKTALSAAMVRSHTMWSTWPPPTAYPATCVFKKRGSSTTVLLTESKISKIESHKTERKYDFN